MFNLRIKPEKKIDWWLSSKEFLCNAKGTGGAGSVSTQIPWKGNGNLFQYSFLENSMDRGDWWATIHGAAKSWTRLSTVMLAQTQSEIELAKTKIAIMFSQKVFILQFDA